MHLTLESNVSDIIKWWANEAFAVHPDMRSYMSATMLTGKMSVYSESTKQKISTQSST